MTREPGVVRGPLGPLGRRLFAAFLVVALSSVAVLTAAALIGADRGLSAARQAERERTAERCAAAAAAAYAAADGWARADLSHARAIAEGAGAHLVVLDRNGSTVGGETAVGSGPGGPGMGRGMKGGADRGSVSAPVTVSSSDGAENVGTVRLGYGPAAAAGGRGVAWEWIAAAALVALVVAVTMSLFVTRRLTGPVRRVTRTARAIAAGDRAARSGVRAPGELGELARAFDGMADEVDRTERARRHVAADVAHELRTPLSALQAGLEELRDGLAEPAPARLAALHDQTLRLGRIVDDLGELAAAESAALSLHPDRVDLGELARTVMADRAPELRAGGITVHGDLTSGVIVNGDPDRLNQAIGNLLANVARYCRPGDSVTVTVRRDHQARGKGAEMAVIEVADTGPGIPPEDLPHVFDRFWRGAAGDGVSGSGIGLAIVRELIVAHGGTVQAASTPTGGATFTLRLPLRTPEP